MVIIFGSPGITLPLYLANGLNKSLVVTTFFSVFPLIWTSPYLKHTPFPLPAQSNVANFKPPPPSLAFFALHMIPNIIVVSIQNMHELGIIEESLLEFFQHSKKASLLIGTIPRLVFVGRTFRTQFLSLDDTVP
jgi:hypothetical protein